MRPSPRRHHRRLRLGLQVGRRQGSRGRCCRRCRGRHRGGVVAPSSVAQPYNVAPATPAEREPLRIARDKDFNTEEYGRIVENPFLEATVNPLSTFGVDVDRASYALVRRFVDSGTLPPRDAVRIEELVNYFEYDYPDPSGNAPFSITTEVASCPWNSKHKLMRIGLQGRAHGRLRAST